MRTVVNEISENSSAGRASPCQGGGRGFESRFSLAKPQKFYLFRCFCFPAVRWEDARVVELVDTPDLKSCALFGRAGSSPASSTFKEKPRISMIRGFFGSTFSKMVRQFCHLYHFTSCWVSRFDDIINCFYKGW